MTVADEAEAAGVPVLAIGVPADGIGVPMAAEGVLKLAIGVAVPEVAAGVDAPAVAAGAPVLAIGVSVAAGAVAAGVPVPPVPGSPTEVDDGAPVLDVDEPEAQPAMASAPMINILKKVILRTPNINFLLYWFGFSKFSISSYSPNRIIIVNK
jgi:hypothetical protein